MLTRGACACAVADPCMARTTSRSRRALVLPVAIGVVDASGYPRGDPEPHGRRLDGVGPATWMRGCYSDGMAEQDPASPYRVGAEPIEQLIVTTGNEGAGYDIARHLATVR